MRDDVLEISYDMRMQNIAFYGSKGSGKSNHVLPMLANEQLDRRSEGALFIIEKSDISWMLYALAKKYHREVLFLTPSCNAEMKTLINSGVSDVSDVDKLVNFVDILQQKKIVIIDAEPYRYQKKSVDLVATLLMKLQTNMHHNSHETPFFVYIEDGDLYLPYVKDLITYGGQFGIGSTLFFQGRALMNAQSPVLSYFVEANIRTTVLMNALIYDDFKYFKERFYGEAEDDAIMMQRKQNQLLVESVDASGNRKISFTDVRFVAPQIIREVVEEAANLREKKLHDEAFSYSVAKEEVVAEPKPKKEVNLQTPTHSARQYQPTSKIFISEEDLFN